MLISDIIFSSILTCNHAKLCGVQTLHHQILSLLNYTQFHSYWVNFYPFLTFGQIFDSILAYTFAKLLLRYNLFMLNRALRKILHIKHCYCENGFEPNLKQCLPRKYRFSGIFGWPWANLAIATTQALDRSVPRLARIISKEQQIERTKSLENRLHCRWYGTEKTRSDAYSEMNYSEIRHLRSELPSIHIFLCSLIHLTQHFCTSSSVANTYAMFSIML